jgi:hypothetical protein
MLTERNKHDIRRHFGQPTTGIAAQGFSLAYRFFDWSAELEYRMINLQATEESTLTGNPYGELSIFGVPTAADTLTATINSTPVVYAVTLADQNAPPAPGTLSNGPLFSVAKNLATAINFANTGIFAGAGPPTSDQTPYQPGGFAEIVLIAVNATTFTLAASQTGGHTGIMVVTAGTTMPTPTVTYDDPDSGSPVTLYGFIPILNYLEGVRFSATQNLDVLQADVVKLRPDEPIARHALYQMARKSLADYLGIPLYPAGQRSGGGGLWTK